MRNILALFLLALLVFVAIELARTIDLPFLSGEEAWGCPSYPQTTKAVAAEIGGSPNAWEKEGERSWHYDGSSQFEFRVPDGCVLGDLLAGQRTEFTGGETLTWR